MLTGQGVQARHEHLYFEYQNQLAVRRGNWKYYRCQQGQAPFALDQSGDEEALYDLAADHHEDHDLKASRPDILRELKACVPCEHRSYTPTPVPVAYEPERQKARSP